MRKDGPIRSQKQPVQKEELGVLMKIRKDSQMTLKDEKMRKHFKKLEKTRKLGEY